MGCSMLWHLVTIHCTCLNENPYSLNNQNDSFQNVLINLHDLHSFEQYQTNDYLIWNLQFAHFRFSIHFLAAFGFHTAKQRPHTDDSSYRRVVSLRYFAMWYGISYCKIRTKSEKRISRTQDRSIIIKAIQDDFGRSLHYRHWLAVYFSTFLLTFVSSGIRPTHRDILQVGNQNLMLQFVTVEQIWGTSSISQTSPAAVVYDRAPTSTLNFYWNLDPDFSIRCSDRDSVHDADQNLDAFRQNELRG